MPQKRDTVVPVRLNDGEALRLDNAIRPKGLTRSAYVRMAMLEKLDRDEPPPSYPPTPRKHTPH